MHTPELRSRLKVEDEVAVMPIDAASPADVLKIDRVAHVGHVFIRTEDERMYAAVDGVDMGALRCLRIEPVTDEHRAAIRRRQRFPRLRIGRDGSAFIGFFRRAGKRGAYGHRSAAKARFATGLRLLRIFTFRLERAKWVP
jgi:hypothetical protein